MAQFEKSSDEIASKVTNKIESISHLNMEIITILFVNYKVNENNCKLHYLMPKELYVQLKNQIKEQHQDNQIE